MLTCYIPQGSTGDEGEGDGIPHIQLGMLSLLTVDWQGASGRSARHRRRWTENHNRP